MNMWTRSEEGGLGETCRGGQQTDERFSQRRQKRLLVGRTRASVEVEKNPGLQ